VRRGINKQKLTFDIIAVTETAELFLTSCVPNVETDRAAIGVEEEGMNFDAEGGNIFLFEFTSQVTLDKSCFAGTAVTNQQALSWNKGMR